MNLLLLPASRNFMRKKGSRMNLSVVKTAVPPVKIPEAQAQDRCTRLFVQNVALPARFLSNQKMTVQYIAAIALQTRDKSFIFKASEDNFGGFFVASL